MQKRVGTVKGLLMLNEEGFQQVNSFLSDCGEQAREDEFIIHELLRYASKDLFMKKKGKLRNFFQKKNSNPYHHLVQRYSILLQEVFEKNIGAALVGFLYDLLEDFEKDSEGFDLFLEELKQIRNQQKEGEVLKKLGELKKKGIDEVDVSSISSTMIDDSKQDFSLLKEKLEITFLLNQTIEMPEFQSPELELKEIEDALQKKLGKK